MHGPCASAAISTDARPDPLDFMYLRSLATAVPPNSFTQEACWDAMQRGNFLATLKPRSTALMEKIFANGTSGIERRNLALDSIIAPFGQGAETLNNNFEREAPPLAVTALLEALLKSGRVPAEVDALCAPRDDTPSEWASAALSQHRA